MQTLIQDINSAQPPKKPLLGTITSKIILIRKYLAMPVINPTQNPYRGDFSLKRKLAKWFNFKLSQVQKSNLECPYVEMGEEGTAYINIPAFATGSGFIQVVADGRLSILTAKTYGLEIPAFSKIKVIKNTPELIVELLEVVNSKAENKAVVIQAPLDLEEVFLVL